MESNFAVVTWMTTANVIDPDMLLRPTRFLPLPLEVVVFSLDGRSFPVLAGKQDCTQAIDMWSNLRVLMPWVFPPESLVDLVAVLEKR